MQPDSTDEWRKPPETTGAAAHPYIAPAEAVSTDVSPVNDDTSSEKAPRPGEEELVRWQAPEHIARDKNPIWYLWFGLAAIAFMILAIFVFRSITFAILVPVMAAALLVYVSRPPLMVSYVLSRKGIHINDQLRGFEEFKEFNLMQEENEHAIFLVPRQRFKLGVTAYFPEEAGEAIVDMLAARLPMHPSRNDPIEWLLRKLRI